MTPSVDVIEETRVTELRGAQNKAEQLFREVETQNLMRPGICESQLKEAIYALAKEMFGISTYWHKRIVRAGPNTTRDRDVSWAGRWARGGGRRRT